MGVACFRCVVHEDPRGLVFVANDNGHGLQHDVEVNISSGPISDLDACVGVLAGREVCAGAATHVRPHLHHTRRDGGEARNEDGVVGDVGHVRFHNSRLEENTFFFGLVLLGVVLYLTKEMMG